MHLHQLSLTDYRSYPQVQVPLQPGPVTFLGLNGVGKTNLVEAVGYLSTLSSHRVAQDAPLVRQGAERAVVRAVLTKQGREQTAEVEINPGRANRARLNRAPLPRSRDLLGTLRTVLFAPEDLALVKGDPAERRRYLDDLLVQRQPRWAAVHADYERVLRQRNALLRSAQRPRRRDAGRTPAGQPLAAGFEDTLAVWSEQLAGIGAQVLYARLRLLNDLGPLLSEDYQRVSTASVAATAQYRSSLPPEHADALHQQLAAGTVPDPEELRTVLLSAMRQLHERELERGHCLVGPQRDDIDLTLGPLPAKGYASHGESWSLALALRLAAYRLLARDLGEDPVLILDDVFAELDGQRRSRLAALVSDCEQVLVTAAVRDDVPVGLTGTGFLVTPGQVTGESG